MKLSLSCILCYKYTGLDLSGFWGIFAFIALEINAFDYLLASLVQGAKCVTRTSSFFSFEKSDIFTRKNMEHSKASSTRR